MYLARASFRWDATPLCAYVRKIDRSRGDRADEKCAEFISTLP